MDAEQYESTIVVSLTDADFKDMLVTLKQSSKSRWQNYELRDYIGIFNSTDSLNSSFMKKEIQTCLRVVAPKLISYCVSLGLSWPKHRIVELFDRVVRKQIHKENPTNRNTRFNVKPLSKLCQRVISSLSKSTLNVVFAEHLFPMRLSRWRADNPFKENILVQGLNYSLNWYCKPEYIADRFQTLFCLLDPHHIFTNARVKCCSSGVKDRGINKEAWVRTAKDGKTIQSIAHVEDLVDRQSDSFARATFSQEVEDDMRNNGF
jgi:hypothetical protein